MGMIARVIDKLVFTALLLFAMQVPILADHYRQYLAGYLDATHEQVEQYSELAARHGYVSVEAMISNLQQNPDAIVRDDANNKAETVKKLLTLQSGLRTLSQGNYYQQAVYMFSPARLPVLQRVLDNFSPSIPLSPAAIGFSVVNAIILNLLLVSPVWLVRKRRQRRQSAFPSSSASRHS